MDTVTATATETVTETAAPVAAAPVADPIKVKKSRQRGLTFTKVSLKDLNGLFTNDQIVIPVGRIWLDSLREAAALLSATNTEALGTIGIAPAPVVAAVKVVEPVSIEKL
jgi:hypothetical protein